MAPVRTTSLAIGFVSVVLLLAAIPIAHAAPMDIDLFADDDGHQCTVTTPQCYVDLATGVRCMQFGPMIPNDPALTLEKCAKQCANSNHNTAGVENGDECWCDDTGGPPQGCPSAPAGDCNVACSGNTQEMCGGQSRLGIYTFNCPTPGPPASQWTCDASSYTCYQSPGGQYPDFNTCSQNCAAPPPGPSPPPSPSPSTPSKSEELSAGSILLLIFFCGLVIPYVVGGLLFMRFRRDARGWEIIPNKEFWIALPGLVKGGFVFIFSKCRGQSYSAL